MLPRVTRLVVPLALCFIVIPVPAASANECYTVRHFDGSEQTTCSERGDSSIGIDASAGAPQVGGGTASAAGPSTVVDGPGTAWDGTTPYCGPDVAELLAALPKPTGPTPVWACLNTPGEPAPAIDVNALGRQAAASLTVPAPVLVLGPEPSVNQWNALAVGLPVWIWAEQQPAIDQSVSQQGIDIHLSAVRGAITIDWGDGTTTVCKTTTARPAGNDPMAESPDCGHTYQRRGDYTITATAEWATTWSALNTSGTVQLTNTGTRQLAISEFEAVVIR